MEDEFDKTQLFGVNLVSNEIIQYSFLENSITSPFNLSPNGKCAIYFVDDKIYLNDLTEKKSKQLYQVQKINNELTGIPNFSIDGKKIYLNQFVPNNFNEKFIQIFELDL